MAAQTYALAFDGYWREPNKNGLPAKSGVYCVYECSYDPQKQTVRALVLIYIGQAANVNARVANHDRLEDWRRRVRPGNELCYSCAPVQAADRDRVEAALIFKHKPVDNAEYVDTFPFPQSTLVVSGRAALLDTHFTVVTTPNY